jgi:Nucleotide modification associated domain 3
MDSTKKSIDGRIWSGDVASPILPCNCLCPVPIPYHPSDVRYSDIRFGNRSLDQICREFPGWENELAHLDPDLRFESLARRPTGWRPAFGQSGISASHLSRLCIDEGDLFVFFGWFRRTKRNKDGKLAFDSEDRDGRHIIYGWLEVERVIEADKPLPDNLRFLKRHPHVQFNWEESPNHIYVGSQSESGLGAGLFARCSDDLVLTRLDSPRSQWQLPPVFDSVFRETKAPRAAKPPCAPWGLSYLNKKWRWSKCRDGKIGLPAVSRGQEFVLDCQSHQEIYSHFSRLVQSAAKAPNHCPHDY